MLNSKHLVNRRNSSTEQSRQLRLSSITSELTAGMLEYESGGEYDNISSSDFDCRERFLSGADTIASELVKTVVCRGNNNKVTEVLPGTREYTYESILQRRKYCKKNDSINVKKHNVEIVDDKVADHAVLLKYIYS